MSASTRHPRGRTGITLLMAVLVLALAGCSDDSSDDGGSEEANTSIAADLRDDVASWAGVSDVRATYQDNATAPGNLQITLSVEPDVDREEVRDQVYAAIWQSEIDPLDRIALRIAVGSGNGDVADYSVTIDGDTTSTFTEQFGERP